MTDSVRSFVAVPLPEKIQADIFAAAQELLRRLLQLGVKWAGKVENLHITVKFLGQIEKEVKKGTIKRIHPMHLLMNLLSMTIFPFVAKPMMIRNLRMNELQFRQAMEERRIEIPKFIIDAIKK